MQKLNFPPYNFRLKKNNENEVEIFDPSRKKWIINTPEEWVRQHWIQFLINDLNIPISVIAVENAFKVIKRQKRSDLQIYKNGNVILLLECKSPTVPINEKVLQQALNYNRSLQVKYIVLSNGLSHKLFEIDSSSGKIIELKELPPYENW